MFKKSTVVDIILKNNRGCINECSIYAKDEIGQQPIEDAEVVEYFLNRKWVYFQNCYVNGRIHHGNIESYKIRKIYTK